jgi:hypothetical protein
MATISPHRLNVLAQVFRREVVKPRDATGLAKNTFDGRTVHASTLGALERRGLIEWKPGEDRSLLYAHLTLNGRYALPASYTSSSV